MEQRFKIYSLRKTYIEYGVILFSLLLITGCMEPKPQQTTTVYPAWFSQTLQDSSQFYYATAQGSNKTDAINNALNFIASKISVSVGSDFQSTTTVSQTDYTKSSQLNVNNHVEKIHFNNYTIIQEKQVTNHYFVAIKVNRIALAQSLKSKILKHLSTIQSTLNMQYKNSVAKLRHYKKVEENFSSIDRQITLLASVNPQADTQKYILQRNSFYNRIHKFFQTISFTLQGADNKYKQKIYAFITQKGYKVTKYRATIRLHIRVKKQKIISLGYKILKGVITIQVFDSKKRSILGEKRIIVAGKSISSFAQADEFMLHNFTQKIQNQKLLRSLLGI